MKRIIKLKKIRKAKRTKIAIRKKRYNKRCSLFQNIYQIESPNNTNEYLINNCSSPFISDEEEDEDSIEIKNSSLICFNDGNSELGLFDCKDVEMTKEKSALLSGKSAQGSIKISKVIR